jgi:hypothetical protein
MYSTLIFRRQISFTGAKAKAKAKPAAKDASLSGR